MWGWAKLGLLLFHRGAMPRSLGWVSQVGSVLGRGEMREKRSGFTGRKKMREERTIVWRAFDVKRVRVQKHR